MKKTLILMTILLVLGNVAKGMEAGSAPLIPVPTFMPYIIKSFSPAPPPDGHIYNDEGGFVTIPAYIASINLMTIAGMPVTVPLCSFYAPPDGEYMSHLFGNGYKLSSGILYTVGGLPFYIIKNVLWNGPVYLYEAMVGDDD